MPARRPTPLARIVRKRLDTLALDMPQHIAEVLHAEAKSLSAVVDEFHPGRKFMDALREIQSEIPPDPKLPLVVRIAEIVENALK